MANKFPIEVTAVDKATATVRKIKDSMAGLTRPADQLGKSLGALGRETGLNKVGKAITGIGATAKAAGEKLGVMVGPMTALTGAATVSGIAALASEWGRLGIETSNAAADVGISASKLAGIEGAVKLAGGSAGAAAAAVKSLGDTMQDAFTGRNQTAVVLLNKVGVGIHHLKNGSIDTARAMHDMADAISHIHGAQAQAVFARQFGLEGLLPILRQGGAAWDRYQKRLEEL